MGQGLAKSCRAAAKRDDCAALERVTTAHPEAVFKTSLWKQRSALHAAASAGSHAALAAVLEVAARHIAAHGSGGHFASLPAFLNAADYGGDTALALACKHGHASCARALVEAGANPLPADLKGATALHYAAAAGSAACIRLLLAAPVRLADGMRRRAADASVPDIIDTERYLDTRTRAGLCALHLAVLSLNQEAVLELATHGALLDTPLLYDALRAPVLMPACLSAGSTALHMAAATGRASLCAALLHAQQQRHPGLELRRLRNARGMTPLNVALQCGHRHLALLLTPGTTAPAPLPAPRSGQLPPLLRQQLLALVHRASLLSQLRQMGLGETAAAAAPQLPGLASGPLARLEQLLHSENATTGQVLLALDEMLDEGDAAIAAAGTGTGGASRHSSSGGGSGSRVARNRRRQQRRQQQEQAAAQQLASAQAGVDWTLLERTRSLWHLEHINASLYRRLHRRHERQQVRQNRAPGRPAAALGGEAAAAGAAAAGTGLPSDDGAAQVVAAGSEEHALLLAEALVQQEQEQQQQQQAPGLRQDNAASSGLPASGTDGAGASAAVEGSGLQEQQAAAGSSTKPQATTAAAAAGRAAGCQPTSAAADTAVCPICLDLPAGVALAPCGHTACLACCGRLASYSPSSGGGSSALLLQGPLCPLCRAPIKAFQPAA